MAFPLPTLAIVAFCLLFGLVSLAWLVAAARQHRRFMATARRAQGVVESLKRESYGRRGVLYFPVVRFTTESGVAIASTSDTGRNESAYRVGQTVSVLYDPKKPSQMRIDSFSSRWIGVILPALFASFAFGFAVAVLLIGR